MERLSVDVVEVAVVEKFIRDQAEDMRVTLAGLSRQVQDVVRGSWSGVSATRFERDWEPWREAAVKVLGDVEFEADTLTRIIADYGRTDDENAQVIDAVDPMGGR